MKDEMGKKGFLCTFWYFWEESLSDNNNPTYHYFGKNTPGLGTRLSEYLETMNNSKINFLRAEKIEEVGRGE